MSSRDELLADLLKATRISDEYSVITAESHLYSALREIEQYERRILKRINMALEEKGPFHVSSFQEMGVQKYTIAFGKVLVDRISQEYGIGCCLMIDKYKKVIEDIKKTHMIVSGGKKKLASGSYPIEFVYRPTIHKNVLDLNVHLRNILFPSPGIIKSLSSAQKLNPTTFPINSIQADAITKALIPTTNTVPYPFLIRGPPGTGKTTTLIEMILQILIDKEGDKKPFIIVCAPSNRAADNIIERFPEGKGSVLRLLSFAEELKLNSTKRLPGIKYDTKPSDADVTVCTIGKLNAFYEENGNRIMAPTHLIIDEASMVPDTDMILVLGLLDKATKFVMFGDEKQLGPVVKVETLKNSFLETSMFERLLKNKQNERASVCLLENYRSCPGIVAPFNNLFYEGRLIAKVAEETHLDIFSQLRTIHKTLMGNISLTENPSGVYFKNVKGSCEQHESTSWRNRKEAKVIVDIMKSLIACGVGEKEIGIITPYLDQVNLIKETMPNDSGVVVGSVDSFQGQERNVILISTVRSYTGKGVGFVGIGFVGNKKRLNVTISRAKTAMIIVGNKQVLKTNKSFKDFFDMNGVHFMR